MRQLYVSSRHSNEILRYQGPSPVSVSNEEELVSEFIVEGNYPNPFSSSTRIEYVLPSASPVTFSVFDVLGREVFAERIESASAGRNAIVFEPEGLPAGVYVYRVQADKESNTGQLIFTIR